MIKENVGHSLGHCFILSQLIEPKWVLKMGVYISFSAKWAKVVDLDMNIQFPEVL